MEKNTAKQTVKQIIKKLVINEMENSKNKFTDYYLVVNLDERGLYSATVYNPNNEGIFEIPDAEFAQELIEDGFLENKPNEDLEGLTKYLMNRNIIPNGSQIWNEEDFEDKRDFDDSGEIEENTGNNEKEYELKLAEKMFELLSNESYSPDKNEDHISAIAIQRMIKDGLLDYNTEVDHNEENGHAIGAEDYYWFNDKGVAEIKSPQDIIDNYFYSNSPSSSELKYRDTEGSVDENNTAIKSKETSNETDKEVYDEIDMRMRPTDFELPFHEINDIAEMYDVDFEDVLNIMVSYVSERDGKKVKALKNDVSYVLDAEFKNTTPSFLEFYSKFSEQKFDNEYEKDQVEQVFKELTIDPDQLKLFEVRKMIKNILKEYDTYQMDYEPRIREGVKSKNNIFDVLGMNYDFAVVKNKTNNKKYVFYYYDLKKDLFPYADIATETETENDFEIDNDTIENYLNDNFRNFNTKSSSVGLEGWNSEDSNLIELNQELINKLVEVYKDDRILQVLDAAS